MHTSVRTSQGALVIKNLPASAEDVRSTGSAPGVGRLTGGGHCCSLQYSCFKNRTDRGAWQATVRGVAESDISEATSHTHTHFDEASLHIRALWQPWGHQVPPQPTSPPPQGSWDSAFAFFVCYHMFTALNSRLIHPASSAGNLT